VLRSVGRKVRSESTRRAIVEGEWGGHANKGYLG
jgi:hypothetical protein